MDINEFFHEFQQDVLSRADANQNFTESMFVDVMGDLLVDIGEVGGFDSCYYRHKTLGIRVDGYSIEEGERLLNLFVSDYRVGNEMETITQGDFLAACRRGRKFFMKSQDPDYLNRLEESSDGYGLMRDLADRRHQFDKVKIHVLSNAVASRSLAGLPSDSEGGVMYVFDLWDLGRMHRLEESGQARESITIDFSRFHESGPLPCLSAHLGDETAYRSYLAVVPGIVLAKLYDEYGQRLLEQNVRTFLQFRGNVNKGMRKTILSSPEMFFAYNNGITATAEGVDTVIEDGQQKLSRITNLQIVNGGQTTASIFTAAKADNADLDHIFVQMKLSVIDPNEVEELVPKISEYANSQNKVNAADFFSNHPFHQKMEEFSRRIWAPSTDGSQIQTHWYYERSRGQYANEQSIRTAANKKEFLRQNPKKQMFTKTDLAKFENSWRMNPHLVSLGAQKNFALVAKMIGDEWEKDPLAFNELYFRDLVAKAILFRELDRRIMKQEWYGGYKANIVTYTLAYFRWLVEKSGKILNLEKIWADQQLEQSLLEQLLVLAKEVNNVITDTPLLITNVSEWCKKEQCWENIKKNGLLKRMDARLEGYLLDKKTGTQQLRESRKNARKLQAIDDGIEAQRRVLEVDASYWQELVKWNTGIGVLTDAEISLARIASMAVKTGRLATEKQSVKLLRALDKALEEGFREPY